MLLVITVTAGRPKAFAALVKWVQKQSIENFHWLIVSDDYDGYKFPKGKNITVIKHDTQSVRPSLNHNMLKAVEWIEGTEYDEFVLLEDDDWYHENYLKETKELLKEAELVGWQEDAYYYVLNRKARRYHNIGQAALACTAFKKSVLPYFKTCCESNDIFIDNLLWNGIYQTIMMPQAPMTQPDGRVLTAPAIPVRQVLDSFKGERLLADNFTGLTNPNETPKMDKAGNIKGEHPRHVGMKQNWHGGLKGLSKKGHDAMQGGGPDIWGDKLKQWIGDDAKFYLAFTINPDGPKTGKPYPANIMLPITLKDED